MAETVTTTIIRGGAVILQKFNIPHLVILITVQDATKVDANVAKTTAKDVPDIPHRIEKGYIKITNKVKAILTILVSISGLPTA